MNNKKHFHILILTVFYLSLFEGICGCEIRQPKVSDTNFAKVVFDHSGITGDCLSCHENTRPASLAAPTYAPVTSFSHYNNEECSLCHIYTTQTWTSATYSHTPAPLSCFQCHEKNRPAPVSSVAHGSLGDCKSCHSTTPPWSSSVTAYTHPENLSSCVLCHEKNRPLTFSKNGTTQAHNISSDCVSCHKAGTWIPATSFDHTPVTASCNSCHGTGTTYDKTVANMHNGMTHPSTGECGTCHVTSGFTPAHSFGPHTGVTQQCSTCHLTQGLYITYGSHALPTRMTLANNELHPTSLSGDCSVCHSYVSGEDFKGHAFTFKHEPKPATCIACHESGSVLVGTSKQTRPASHLSSTDVSKKMGDCASCHTSTTSWSLSSGDIALAHQSYTSCNTCHASGGASPRQRPAQFSVDGTATGLKVNHNATQECNVCHTFAGGWYQASKYDHDQNTATVSCQDCHGSSGIAMAKDKAPSSIRATATVPHPNLVTCSSCHVYSGFGSGWQGHTFNYNHGPTSPTSCILCHENQRITTHANEVPRPATMTLNFSVTKNHPTSGDCITCHTQPPTATSFMPATNYTHSLLTTPTRSTTTPPTPLRHCIACHESGNYVSKANDKRPTNMPTDPITNSYASGHYNISSEATAPTDCFACHSSSSWTFVESTHKSNVKKMSGYVGTTPKSSLIKDNCATTCH